MLGKLFKQTTTTVAVTQVTSKPVRMFSRADIIKGLDRSKVSRRAFIKKELTENPEFLKAFPHMQVVFNIKEEGQGKMSRTPEMEEDDGLTAQTKYEENAHLGFKDPSGRSNAGYFDSLLHHHNQYMAPSEKEQAIRENERNFVDAYLPPTGPSKWLTKEELTTIHDQIDQKM